MRWRGKGSGFRLRSAGPLLWIVAFLPGTASLCHPRAWMGGSTLSTQTATLIAVILIIVRLLLGHTLELGCRCRLASPGF